MSLLANRFSFHYCFYCSLCFSAAWFSYVTCEHVNLIKKLFTKAFRLGFVSKKYNATELLSD